jgi:hypothetical protein
MRREHDDLSMIGRTLADTYRVLARLGVGAMGTVFEAEQIRLKRTVALKILATQHRENVAALKRFHNEVRALVLLDHPHIVRILDFATSADGRPFLVMERLSGSTVGDELTAGHRFSVSATVDIALQVSEALVAAHSKGIVHRDLKPDNLFLCTDAGGKLFVKVLDFGVSRLPESEGARITADNEVLGTPEYMSPEQALGRNDWVNGRADQHALALVMYEMLSGVSPFAAADLEEALNKVALEVPELVSDHAPNVPRALALVLRRAMSKDPQHRYPGIDEFMDAVGAAGSARSIAPASVGRRDDAPPGSMLAAKGASPRDPVRTIALLLSRTRTAFLTGAQAKATALATTALDAAVLTDDEAILALIEMARPLLEGVFHTSLEPMDRRLVAEAIEPGLLSQEQGAFRYALRGRATIAEAIHASPLSRLDTLRTLVELEALGAVTFQAPIPGPRLHSQRASSVRVPLPESVVPRVLKRA